MPDIRTERRKRRPPLFYIVVAVAIIAVMGAVVGLYYYTRPAPPLSTNTPEQTAKERDAQLVEKVGMLILLPQGETPTVATVSDLSKLQDQLFFANAQIGDLVLIYTQARKAIIYRPSLNKIIEVGPLVGGAE